MAMATGVETCRSSTRPSQARWLAILRHTVGKKESGGRNVLIHDMGDGTFKMSLLMIEDCIFDAKSTADDTPWV
eukprot:6221799-Karenia_brevis.AAC.1